jgi:hypothetical protein
MAPTVVGGTITAVPKVKGPGNPPPLTEVSVTVYDWMTTLSSAVDDVIVGFFRLFRRVAQAMVVVPVSMDDSMVPVLVAALVPVPIESTDRKTNALPL